jgi:hypothetical protein
MSDTSETIQGWSSDIEELCGNIQHNATVMSGLHKQRYLDLSHKQVYFKLPIIILSSINSIFSVGLGVYMAQEAVSTTNCLISLLCGIISSIELYFQIQKGIESELTSYRAYYLLSVKINNVLKLKPEHRKETSGSDFLTEVENSYCALFENSNVNRWDMNDKLLSRLPNRIEVSLANPVRLP